MNSTRLLPKRPTLRWAILIAVVALGFTVLPAASALADAGTNASCMGHEASAISPPGSSEEINAGVPGLKAFISDTFPGLPPGKIFSAIADLREGSHEACDAAFE